uniref:Uncharacterized protein n=1 Tax=Vespula pensylvanica TaxID=30213 RepID=A0A834NZ79_VESPE|nr:hypothetical protein H0235_009808 [Vespula pensylvanica]
MLHPTARATTSTDSKLNWRKQRCPSRKKNYLDRGQKHRACSTVPMGFERLIESFIYRTVCDKIFQPGWKATHFVWRRLEGEASLEFGEVFAKWAQSIRENVQIHERVCGAAVVNEIRKERGEKKKELQVEREKDTKRWESLRILLQQEEEEEEEEEEEDEDEEEEEEEEEMEMEEEEVGSLELLEWPGF